MHTVFSGGPLSLWTWKIGLQANNLGCHTGRRAIDEEPVRRWHPAVKSPAIVRARW